MNEAVSTLMHWMKTYGLTTLYALLILVVGWILVKGIASICRKVLIARHAKVATVSFCGNLLYFILLAIVIIAALEKVGINTAGGIGIGLLIGACAVSIGLTLKYRLTTFDTGPSKKSGSGHSSY